MQIDARFNVGFTHRLRFTQDALSPDNPALGECLEGQAGRPPRVLAFVDTLVARCFVDLPWRLRDYAAAHGFELAGGVEPVVGGELCKNDREAIYRVLEAIARAGLDRQSYVLAIGGGAVLDCVGFAAAIAHRGVRLVRMPTTTLAQADSGVGVKSGINGFGQKNYLGAFAVPWAVVCDSGFLAGLSDRDWRAGFSEAVKVALLKDAALFEQIAVTAGAIAARDVEVALPVIRRSAQLHLAHITAGGDPFEMSAARPLDLGHWAAHRLEQMSGFALRHGEAVAIGLALDIAYARRLRLLPPAVARAVHDCLAALGFALYDDAMADTDGLLRGMEEFRAHLGGELTLTNLRGIGRPVDLHEIDPPTVRAAIEDLRALNASLPPQRRAGATIAPAGLSKVDAQTDAL